MLRNLRGVLPFVTDKRRRRESEVLSEWVMWNFQSLSWSYSQILRCRGFGQALYKTYTTRQLTYYCRYILFRCLFFPTIGRHSIKQDPNGSVSKKLCFLFLMNIIMPRNLQHPSHNYAQARVKRMHVGVNFLTSKFNPPTSSVFSLTNISLRTDSNDAWYVVLCHIDRILPVQPFACSRIR
jgi:hypothetical protein